MSTFTAYDGKEWALDEWHPLPFMHKTRGFTFPCVPTMDAGHRLVRRFSNGDVLPWGPFSTYEGRLRARSHPPTHWMVRSWSDYTI
jgi:hypothetical protein